jgi:hypothetical protein
LATVAPATPRWLARRPLLPASSTAPPARWAAIPARFTGVQRAHPVLATRSRCSGASTTAAAPLRPTAPMSEPPNQAARPRSCNERARVLFWAMPATSCALLLAWWAPAGAVGVPFRFAAPGQVLPGVSGVDSGGVSWSSIPALASFTALRREYRPVPVSNDNCGIGDGHGLFMKSQGRAIRRKPTCLRGALALPAISSRAINPQFTAGLGGAARAWHAHQPAGPTARPMPACLACAGMAGRGYIEVGRSDRVSLVE